MGTDPTLDRTISCACRAHGDRQAILDGDRTYSYSELERVIEAVAGRLAHLGVGKGDRVAFLSDMHADYTVTWLACVTAGAIPAPIHTRSSEQDQLSMCASIEPGLLLHQEAYDEAASSLASEADVRTESFGLDAETSFVDVAVADDAGPPDVAIAPEDPATIFFTSGTTGVPTPYVHRHEAMVEAAHIEVVMMKARRSDVSLNAFPPSVTAFVLLTLPYLAVGATTASIDRWSPTGVVEAIEGFRPTSTVMTPTQARKLFDEVDMTAVDTSSLDRLVCGGEPATGQLLDRIRDTICENVSFGYGNTESLNSCVLFPDEADPSTVGSVGRPLPETELRLVEPGEADADLEMDVNEVGEIAVRSPLVADGVWGRETPSERFSDDGWLFTGDLGRVDEDGLLYVEGRVDNMILTGGRKVYPEHVEKELQSHPDVTTVVVVGVSDDEWGERVTAFVEGSPELTEERLLAWCEDRTALASYQVPKAVRFVDEMPRTTTGKIDRDRLTEAT